MRTTDVHIHQVTIEGTLLEVTGAYKTLISEGYKPSAYGAQGIVETSTDNWIAQVEKKKRK